MRRRVFVAATLSAACAVVLTGCAVVFAKEPTAETVAGTYVFDPDSSFVPHNRDLELILDEDGTVELRDFPAAPLAPFADEAQTYSLRGTWRVLARETPVSNYRIELNATLPERRTPSTFVGQLSVGDDPRSIHFWIDPDGDRILDLVRTD